MRLRAAAAILALPVVLLAAGCGSTTSASSPGTTGSAAASSGAAAASSDQNNSDPGVSGSSAAGSPSSEAPTPGPAVPPATAVAAPVPADQLPTASGKFGEKPEFTFPKTPPPPSLQRQVLTEGTGKVVKAGDWLVTHYLGQVWGGKVFDNSYDRKSTTTFQIGAGKVVTGWDIGLVGQKIGSRVMLSLPPADGYGAAGNPSAGIKGTDTIVFIVDIVDAIGADRGGQADAKPVALPAGLPEVGGALGKAPTVTVKAGTPEPTASKVYPLSTGTGAKLAEGDGVLVQFVAVSWDGKPQGSTWPSATSDPSQSGLQQAQVSKDSPFAALVGQTIGSRVLLVLPKSTSQQGEQPAIAVVIDLVAKS